MYIRITKDENFNPEEHSLSHAPAQAEAACSYDLDECDVAWLKILNAERASAGMGPVYEDQLERAIERLELCCWEKIQSILRNEEGLGIEYDENVICDVCRSPDSEEGNEMVFCDSCNICVHQACYGITRIPEGQWLCCTCNIGKRPECVLCPNKGGAMKSTRSGQKWAHVSCALWIPEVSIGCVEKMEPITKISSIPSSRWALICVLCRERVGACIQCSVKTCKTAYHVTCAFKHGLEMRAIIEDENADDGVKLRSYCEKHSKSSKKEKSVCSGSEDDDSKRKKRKDMTSEEKNQARAIRLQEIEAEFFKHVNVKDVSIHLDVDSEAIQYIYNYWKLKRKSGHNKPLLPPKSDDVDMLSHKREQADMEKMKMFVQLRQDLERVRNLCYMVSRREKLSRTFFRMREQTFHKQTAVLNSSNSLPTTVVEAVIEANHGPSIYDRLYSHNEAEDHTSDFDTILARIAGIKSPKYSGDESKPDINGLFKDVKNNPYKKVYYNGSSKRRSMSMYETSMSSASSSEERPKDNKENRLQASSEDEKLVTTVVKRRGRPSKVADKRRQKKLCLSNAKIDSSSEEDIKPAKQDWNQLSRSRLSQVDKELGDSCSDSDELLVIRSSQKGDNHKSMKSTMSSIYSDTDSSDVSMKNDDKSSNATNDSQSKLRTKAAVKDFTHKPSTSKSPNKSNIGNKKKLKDENKVESPTKKKEYVPQSDLIVPQRQAAKKATENIKSNTTSRTKDHVPATEEVKIEDKSKVKIKPKTGKEKEPSKEEDKPKDKEVKESKEKDIKEPKVKEVKDMRLKESKENTDKINKMKDPKPVSDSSEIEKDAEKIETEIFTYVPQREAAKKAAEHIKSGLGKPAPATAESISDADKAKKDTETKSKKDIDVKKSETKKEAEIIKPAKITEHKNKSSTNSTSTSSSSSSSSSDSSSSSSSDSEEEPAKQPSENNSPSTPRETDKRSTAKDWPFLDKGPRPAASSGSSSSSDSSDPSPPRKSSPVPSTPKPTTSSSAATESPTKSNRKRPDKKQSPPLPKREEQPRSRGRGRRASRGRPRTSKSGDRVGNADVRPRDLSDGQRLSVEGEGDENRKGKPTARVDLEDVDKEETASSKLLPSVRKTDKKLKSNKEPETSYIEKEILERKAGKEGHTVKSKTSSTFERLFGTPEKKDEKVVSLRKDSPKDEEKPSNVPHKTSILAPGKLTVPSVKDTKVSGHQPEENSANEKTPHRKTKQERLPGNKLSSDFKSDMPETVSKPSDDKVTSIPEAQEELKKETSIYHKNDTNESDKKIETNELEKKQNKKVSPKNKIIEDILPNKVSSSESKENTLDDKESLSKYSKSDEITIADKIVNDHLQSHKANDLYKQTDIPDAFMNTSDVAKSLLSELEAEKKDIKASGITNQVLQNRPIFSPQPHDKELLDFNFDEIGLNKDDEIIKNPLTWHFGNTSLVKEDTKEDNARETQNLISKLREGLSKKSGCEADDGNMKNEENDASTGFSEQDLTDNANEAIEQQTKNDFNNQSLDLQLQVKVSEIGSFDPNNKQPQSDYIYPNCDTSVPLEPNRNVPVQSHETLTDHITPIEGDERWVPPSDFTNAPPVDPTTYLNNAVTPAGPAFFEPFPNTTTQEHHPEANYLPVQIPTKIPDQPVNPLPNQLDLKLQEDALKTHSPSLHEKIDRRISQTPLIDPSLDCMNSPMPYSNIHPQAKWADCEVIPKCRSSSSSAASTSSSSSRREEEDIRNQDVRTVNHSTLDMATYLPAQVPPFQPNPMDNFGGYSDGSLYPVSLFNAPNLNTEVPYPTAGTGTMFPSAAFGAAFPTPHPMPTVPKPAEETIPYSSTCTAAFTSSQHNMALTAALAIPTSMSKPLEQQLQEQLISPGSQLAICSQPSLTPTTTTEDIVPSPALSNTTPTANSTLPSPSTSLKSNSSAGKKSPSKPTRTSARVTSQMLNKSPAKSPGKSPRQEVALKQSGPGRGRGDSKRGMGKTGSSRGVSVSRGRGRGRGRGKSGHYNDYDFVGTGSIHNKLVGTVYDLDFDDDISNDNMTDLKSMRERRKSVDVHDRKYDTFSSTRDSPRSPKFHSPSQASHKTRNYNADLRDLRPPSPIEDSKSKTDISLSSCDTNPPQIFPVTPVLPGPVDMRTYSNFDQHTYNEQNLLSAFASGTTETQVQDIDEDFEKELHTALTAKKPDEPAPAEMANNIKVSLSDSRNQLKVKIKGPIANYTSSVPPLPPPNIDPIVSNVNTVNSNAINSASMGMSSGGTSSLRRMRKKELLRNYLTQDMNMDDATSNSGYIAPAAPLINRTIITIPKAVASMTSIPTKEDYRDYRTDTDDFVESKHHRKESKARPGGLSRELRQLDLSSDNDGYLERRRSVGSAGSNNSNLSASLDNSLSNKRRGRPPRPLQQPSAPKLKIKIGNNTNSIVGAINMDDKKDRIRPPKKRLAAAMNKPSVEDLKRESMKFRKMVIKDLKIKHKKKDKSEKKKKKKIIPEVQIITNQDEHPTKLIFRFGKKSDSDADKRTSSETSKSSGRQTEAISESPSASSVSNKKPCPPADDQPPQKWIPIKLKLSRSQEGSYVMKRETVIPNLDKVEEDKAVQPGEPPPDPLALDSEGVKEETPASETLDKDCKVR